MECVTFCVIITTSVFTLLLLHKKSTHHTEKQDIYSQRDLPYKYLLPSNLDAYEQLNIS